MTIYPEVLKKAQAEVDAVIGHERLPTTEDRDALPYANAICSELLRWNVITPISTCPCIISQAGPTSAYFMLAMRVNTQDVIYEGHLIPKGTQLLANIWSVVSRRRRPSKT